MWGILKYIGIGVAFLACTRNTTQNFSADTSKDVQILAAEKLGSDNVCVDNMVHSHTLCFSRTDGPVPGALSFFIYDQENRQIIYEEKIATGEVQWTSESVVTVQKIPGIYQEGKTKDDYSYEIDVIKLKADQP